LFSPVPGLRGEGHAGGGVIAPIAEDHGHDVDGGAVGQIGGDVELAAVIDGAATHPAIEDGLDGDLELIEGVRRERLAGVGSSTTLMKRSLISWRSVAERSTSSLTLGLVLDPLELLVEQFVREPPGPPCRRAG
jgi:hypothetical protein